MTDGESSSQLVVTEELKGATVFVDELLVTVDYLGGGVGED